MILPLEENRPAVPPADMILRVACGFEVDSIDGARRSFDHDALDHLQRFENALAATGRSLADAERLLDFGCGCGRFLRHMRPLAETVELHGTDIDAEMIEWVTKNIPYAQASVGQMTPPLPYPNEHFDVVINHSVFTHLDEHHQDLWLAELRRITRAGGLLLLTFEGPSSWNRTAALSEAAGDDVERWRNELESRGILSITDDHFIGSTHPDTYHSTVHAPWYVLEHWSEFFDIITYLPDGSISQDMVVLRRRPDDAPAPRPVGRRFAGQTVAATSRADALNGTEAGVSEAPELDPVAVSRQLNMLRAAIYEQGRRLSVVTVQLRDEIAENGPTITPPPAPSPSGVGDTLRTVARSGLRWLREHR